MLETDRFLRRNEVEKIVGLGRSQIYEMMKTGDFPRPVRIGGAVRWSQQAIAAWQSMIRAASAA